MSSSWDRILKISLQQFYKTLSFFYVFWYGLTFIALLYMVLHDYGSANDIVLQYDISSIKKNYLFYAAHSMKWRNWIKMQIIKSKCKSLMRNKFCATFNVHQLSIMPNVFLLSRVNLAKNGEKEGKDTFEIHFRPKPFLTWRLNKVSH